MIIIFGLGSVLLVIGGNLAELRPPFRPWLRVLLLLLSLVLACISLSLLFFPEFPSSVSLEALPQSFLLSLLIVALLSGATVFFPVRQFLSRFLPLRPASSMHLVAIYLSLYLFAWIFLNLSLMGGVEGMQEEAESVPLWLLFVQAGIFVFFALLGVGFPFRRSWRDTLRRLGLDQFPLYTLIVVPLSVIILVSLNFIVAVTWTLLDPAGADAINQLSEALLGDYESLGAGFLLGLLPGISEELLFRGAIQPGLGLVYTSALFAAIHLQYALSPATLAVFILGLALGFLRRHFGTWAAILTHFAYNFSLFLLGLIANQFLETMG